MDLSPVLAPVRDLGEYIREQRISAQISVRALASKAGVSNPYLSQVERGLRRPSAGILNQIAQGLSISTESLLIRAGILQSADAPAVVHAIRADASLSERQKSALIDIYQAFRAGSVVEETAAQAEHIDQQAPPPAPRTATGTSSSGQLRSAAVPTPRAGSSAVAAGATPAKHGGSGKPTPTAAAERAGKTTSKPARKRAPTARKHTPTTTPSRTGSAEGENDHVATN